MWPIALELKMIYPSDFESKTSFDVVRGLVAEKCSSRLGASKVEAMAFSSDFETVRRRLSETAEMLSLLRSGVDMPPDSSADIVPSLIGLKAAGSFMDAVRLYQLVQVLESFESVSGFFCRCDSDTGKYQFKWLSRTFSGLRSFPAIVQEISRCVNRFGEVLDSASDLLYDLRRQISSASGHISIAMKRVADRAVAEGIVDKDVAVSMRDGRMVLPVPAGSKRRLQGILHDESATGKTVYIEPAEVVEATNRLKELQIEEQREVARILTEIADRIRPHIDEIVEGCNILADYDFIRAKARFAMETDAHMPTLHKEPGLDWYGARHPVLQLNLAQKKQDIVPINIALDREKRFLMVSGPNAGGKSVTLKTVAVVQYMAQCGLLPNLWSNSHLGIFKKLMIDIGDQQSIDDDLSTYSSHLAAMKFFLKNADAETLLFADEMGSGTEPAIGGAIAQAILMKLAGTGCFGIVTTHYRNLKNFAEETDGFVNGAMLYDRQNLRPAFQLVMGAPGNSFALEIARNIGLPTEIVETAKELVGSDYVESEKFLLDIARDRKYWSNKRKSIREKEAKLERLLQNYEEVSSELRKNRTQILGEARREAKDILADANSRIEKTIREIRNAEADKEKTRQVRLELQKYREELEKEHAESKSKSPVRELPHKSKSSRRNQPEVSKNAYTPPQVGDYVRMSDGGVVGKIISISGNKAEVAFGGLRTFTELSKLKHAQKPEESASAAVTSVSVQTSAASRERQLNFRQEIDVRGMRADEALQAVTYFLDDAVQFNASRVRILHGTGHGILKSLIRQMLSSYPGVKSFADEDVRFGGAGITVVNLG